MSLFLQKITVSVPSGSEYNEVSDGVNTIADFFGNGSPEGVVTAGPGSSYRDYASGNMWIKDSGVGVSGWRNATNGILKADTTASLSSAGMTDGDLVETLGRLSPGDGGGELFVYRATGRSAVSSKPYFGQGFYFAGPGADDYFESLITENLDSRRFAFPEDGVTDCTSVMRLILAAASDLGIRKVFIAAGTYLIDNRVNLPDNLELYGESSYQTVLLHSPVNKQMLTVAPYDWESNDSSTKIGDKENILVRDLTFDFNTTTAWNQFGVCISFKNVPSTEAGSGAIRDVTLERLRFINSSPQTPAGSDSWCINTSAYGDDGTQERLTIRNCVSLAEDHQFISGGGAGWSTMTVEDNYVYHPRSNGIAVSTIAGVGRFRNVRIRNNRVIGPTSLGIWVGPDGVTSGNDSIYAGIAVEGNVVVFDSHSDNAFPAAIRVNCGRGRNSGVRVIGNTLVLEDSAPAVSYTFIEMDTGANGNDLLATLAADFTQPALGAPVTFTTAAAIPDNFGVGQLITVEGGGTYEVTTYSGTSVTASLVDGYPYLAPGGTVVTGASIYGFGTISDVVISNNSGDRGIRLENCVRTVLSGNVSREVIVASPCRQLAILGNQMLALRVEASATGSACGNSFVNGEGLTDHISVNLGTRQGLPEEDHMVYAGNVVANYGEENGSRRLVLETDSGGGVFNGTYFYNFGPRTSTRGMSLVSANSPLADGRRVFGNVYSNANLDGLAVSEQSKYFHNENLTFDLSANNTQTVSIPVSGARIDDLIHMSGGDRDDVGYHVRGDFNSINVTAFRLDPSVPVASFTDTFNFHIQKAR